MEPRYVDRSWLAKHLHYKRPSAAMDNWVKTTLQVSPIPGRRGIYDRLAIKAALDKLSGLPTASAASAQDESDAAFDEFMQSQQ